MSLRRLVLCDLLGLHTGTIVVARASTERLELAVTFMPCSRCGELHPLDIRPYGEMESAVLGAPLREHR